MPRYKLTIAYEGTDFCGWQKQEPPDPDAPKPAPGEEPQRIILRTVQDTLEKAVRAALREPITLTGASRTDSGVHAWGQCASFYSEPDPEKGVGWPEDRGLDTLVRAVNGKLPRDVLVRDAEVVPDEFNPISDAIEKEYTYTFATGHDRPIWDRRLVFHTWHDLDLSRMQDAAKHLVGEHDFASFAQINHGRKTTVRRIFNCTVEDATADGEPRLRVRVSGSGFLYNMVRILAGTLMEAGRGKIDPNQIPAILESADRTANPGPTLPPQGLRLEWIRYEAPT